MPYSPTRRSVHGVERAGPEAGPEPVLDLLTSHRRLDRERGCPTPGGGDQRDAGRPIAGIGKQIGGRRGVPARRFARLWRKGPPPVADPTHPEFWSPPPP